TRVGGGDGHLGHRVAGSSSGSSNTRARGSCTRFPGPGQLTRTVRTKSPLITHTPTHKATIAHGLATDRGGVPVPGSAEPFSVRRHRVHKWVPRTVHSSNRKTATAIRTDKGASGTVPSPGIKEPRRYSRDTTITNARLRCQDIRVRSGCSPESPRSSEELTTGSRRSPKDTPGRSRRSRSTAADSAARAGHGA